MRMMKRCLRVVVLAMASSLALPSIGLAEKGDAKGPSGSGGEEVKAKVKAKADRDKGPKAMGEDKERGSDKKPGEPQAGSDPKGLAMGKGHEKGEGLALGKGHEKGEGLALGKDGKPSEGAADEAVQGEPTEEELAKRAAKRAERLERLKERRLALGKNMQHRKAFEDGEGKMGKLAKERRKHLRRMARINRLLAVAAEKQDTAIEERVKALQTKEKERHDRFMSAHRGMNK